MKLLYHYCKHQNIVIFLTIGLFFSAGLTLHVLNLSFFILLLLALIKLIQTPSENVSFREVYQSYKYLHWAMASMLIALLICQTCHGYVDLAPYNPIARLAIFVMLLWVMVNLPFNQLCMLRWAWIVGSAMCAVQIYFAPRFDSRPDIENWYVALAGLLGVLSVISLAWIERPGKLSIIAHLLGGLCGLYTIFVCQTRGVWLALPLFIVLGYLTFADNALNKKNIVLLVLGITVFGVLFMNTDLAKKRINQAESDIKIFHTDNNAATSIGIRLQLWKASVVMFEEHPLIGVGPGDHYKVELQKMVDRKVLPLYYNGAHTHNEILYSAATMGVPGLIAILLTYFVPGYYFGRLLRDGDKKIRAAAAMGFSVVAGFMIFGMIDVLFKYKETEIFYAVSCAVLLAYITNRAKQMPQVRQVQVTN